jgi:predicted PurR-regulated permease PerM
VKRAGDEIRRTTTPRAPSGVTRVNVVERRLDLRPYLLATGYRLFIAGIDVLTIVLLTFLLMATGDLFRRKIVALAAHTAPERAMTTDLMRAIDRQIERYLQTRLLISAIVGSATAVAMWAVGLEHPIIWGIVAGVLNVLPYVGPMTAVALIGLAAFLQFKTLETAALAAGLATVIAAVEGNLITPWLTSRAGDLNTVAVFVAVLFWGWMWGMWGLLLAVPILVTAKAVADHVDRLKPFGELVSR